MVTFNIGTLLLLKWSSARNFWKIYHYTVDHNIAGLSMHWWLFWSSIFMKKAIIHTNTN